MSPVSVNRGGEGDVHRPRASPTPPPALPSNGAVSGRFRFGAPTPLARQVSPPLPASGSAARPGSRRLCTMREGEMKGSFEGRLGRGEGAHRFRQSDGLEDGRVRGTRTTRKTQGGTGHWRFDRGLATTQFAGPVRRRASRPVAGLLAGTLASPPRIEGRPYRATWAAGKLAPRTSQASKAFRSQDRIPPP